MNYTRSKRMLRAYRTLRGGNYAGMGPAGCEPTRIKICGKVLNHLGRQQRKNGAFAPILHIMLIVAEVKRKKSKWSASRR